MCPLLRGCRTTGRTVVEMMTNAPVIITPPNQPGSPCFSSVHFHEEHGKRGYEATYNSEIPL